MADKVKKYAQNIYRVYNKTGNGCYKKFYSNLSKAAKGEIRSQTSSKSTQLSPVTGSFHNFIEVIDRQRFMYLCVFSVLLIFTTLNCDYF